MKHFLDLECGIVINNYFILIHMLWANDLILFSDRNEGLQRQLDGLFSFVSKPQLIVNTLKTEQFKN